MTRTIRALLLCLSASLFGTVAFLPGTASAAKVGNPGSFSSTVTQGTLRVKAQTFTFDDSQPITFAGSINSQGQITNGSVNFPAQQVNASGIDVTVHINPATNAPGPVSGSINPLTGVASLRLRVWIKIDGVPFGGDCHIATATSPIDVNALITGTTSPPGPNTPITGALYDTTNGTLKIVNNNFSVPAATDCGPANGTVNDSLGLPSAAGNNEGQFVNKTTPILTKGLAASLTATPPSGVAPVNVTFNGAATAHAVAVQSYQWDFDGNGTFDQTTAGSTTTFNYAVPGSYQARLRVTDVDGDTSDAVRQVVINPPGPELSITKSHTGNFRIGTPGAYTLSIANGSIGATTGPVTVTDTLPTGLTFQSATGAGWTCGAAGQTVTCTRPSVAGSSTAPAITVTVGAGTPALPSVTNTATVATAGDPTASDNTAGDPTNVTAVDLSLDKSHAGTLRPGPGNHFSLAVSNFGTATTYGPATVTDSLPAGLTYVAATGAGWTCGAAGQLVTCTTPAGLAAGASAPAIDLEVSGAIGSGQSSTQITNTASVTTNGDAFPANNQDSDDALIVDAPDVGIVKSHNENFTAGSQETYSLAVRNGGPQPTTGATIVTDNLPAGLTYASATGVGWNCGASGQLVTCTRPTVLPADTSAAVISLKVDVGLAAIPAVANTASVATTGDPNPANDSSTDPTLVRAIDVVVDKSHDGVFRVNRNGVYHLQVSNQGGSATVGPTSLTDNLPAGLTYVGATGTGWTCSAAGQAVSCLYAAPIAGSGGQAPVVTLTVAVSPSATPSVTNTATVTTEDDFQPGNDADTDVVPVIDVDVGITKSHLGAFTVGETRTYTLAVDNPGSLPTSGTIVVSDTLPTGLTFLAASGNGWSCSSLGQDVTCTRATPLPAESKAQDISLRVSVGQAAVPLVTNTATVTTPGDRNASNDSSSDPAAVVAPDLAAVSTHAGRFRAGASGIYVLRADNVGTGPTTGTSTLTDTLPAGLIFKGAAGNGWSCAAAGQVVTCTHEDAVPAGTMSSPVAVTVLATGSAGQNITNSVTASTPGDSAAGNDIGTDPTAVDRIDLVISLGRGGPITVGSGSTYSAIISNQGTAATVGPIRVTDTLPAGVEPLGAAGDGWACTVNGRLVSCERPGPLPAGATAPGLTIRVLASPSVPNVINNVAQVSTQDDVVATNDTDPDSTSPTRDPDLALSLTTPGALRAGGSGTFALSLRNVGGSAAPGPTTIVTSLAPGLGFTDGGGDGWACSADGSEVTCVRGASVPVGGRTDFSIAFTVAAEAAPSAITNAGASNASDPNADNDTASTNSPVTAVDLALTKTHNDSWRAGGTGHYALTVANVGTAATVGQTTVTDTLPADITFAAGKATGWSCSASGQTVTCTRATSIAAAGAPQPIAIDVNVRAAAAPAASSTATVTTADDVNAANDSATDSVDVSTVPATDPAPVSRPAAVRAGTVKMTRSGFVAVTLGCPPDATARCTGKLTLVSAKKAPVGKKKKKILALGAATYSIGTGRTATVTVKVPKASAKVVTKLRKITARATAAGDGVSETTTTLTVKGP